MDHLCELKLDPRDPDQIIRDLRDRIAELEPSLADWKDMAMKFQAEVARLRDALAIAKEAMDERRSYVNAGDPATCWQEMKYGDQWDAEDALVEKALGDKGADRGPHAG